MENKSNQVKSGQITITYKMKLYHRHLEDLILTKKLYNQVLKFYYEILLEQEELLELSNFLLMRELEILSVGTKEDKKENRKPKYSLQEFPTLPLYFRRAIINHAISLMRSYKSNYQNWLNSEQKKKCPIPAQTFCASPIYYKGMYKDFTGTSIWLKVFDGKRWNWLEFPYRGRKIPEKAVALSPVIYLKGKNAWLHVPVSMEVEQVKTIAERMKEEEKILAVSFPHADTMAVCAILLKNGKMEGYEYIRGGKEWRGKKKRLLERLEKSQKSRKQICVSDNKKIFQKIENLNDSYAHQISRQILEYGKKHQIQVIAVPNYEMGIEFSKRKYFEGNRFDWIGRKIIKYLKYKAFQEGMIVGTVRPYHISDSCAECGSRILKYNGGKLYVCSKGHRGNSGLNTARNIGQHFLKNYNN